MFKMRSKIVILTVCVFLCECAVNALSFPGPRVYVVTPSARLLKKDEGRPTPFYYHNWMRRMDTGPNNISTTTTTEAPASNVKTPDLIFAEFESDGSKQKSIKRLLEKERILPPKKTTMSPIYVPDEEETKITRVVNYGLPLNVNNHNESTTEDNKYTYMYRDDYYNNLPAPLDKTAQLTTLQTPTTKITTTTASPINIQNIWHVIDSEKSDQSPNSWNEISFAIKNKVNAINTNNNHNQKNEDEKHHSLNNDDSYKQEYDQDDVTVDDNFALPGFATNPGNGAENESRAIRTEQNIKFPYINLKPFQMKLLHKPPNDVSNGKKNNLYTNLDNFYDLKNPVRGEAQDYVPLSSHIDRYNPAQPYLPQQKYGNNFSKDLSPASSPPKATGSLVPPPLPPPQSSGNDFPSPISYESFPPYAPSALDFGPASAPAPPPPPASVSITPSKTMDMPSEFDTSGLSPTNDSPAMDIDYRYKPPSSVDNIDNSASMMNHGYHYKPSSAPTPQFYPTPLPPSKPFQGYSYNKPSMTVDTLMSGDKPDFHGYHYSKPVYKPPIDSMPPSYGSPVTYGHDDFPPEIFDHDDSYPHVVGQDDAPPYSHDSDDDITSGIKPDDMKGGDGMNGHDMGMMPPPLETDVKPGAYGPPPDDHGFPSDFPTDFKFHPEFHDHDEHYHIVEHPTTTTETPRVNRFSYYYLGKKLYYLPLYFSVYFIIYVGALIIKAVLRHKIVYPNSWRPNTTTATFFSKRSVDEYLSHENLHDLTQKVTHAIATAAETYMDRKNKSS